jgi:hypothetical protein
MQRIVIGIVLLAGCHAKERRVPHEIVEKGPGSLEITDEGMQPTIALTMLLKLRASSNAAAFEPAIQFLINDVCGTPGDAAVDIDYFFPMDSVAELEMAGCGTFYLKNGSTICGPRSKLSGKCVDIILPAGKP